MNGRAGLILSALLAFAIGGHGEVNFTTTNTTWKLLKGTAQASFPDPTTWRQPAFNDNSWSSVPAPIYYTATPTEPPFYGGGPVTGTVLTDMINSYTCVFLRKTFTVASAAA